MAALGSKLRTLEGGLVGFRCPGCESMHAVGVQAPAKLIWEFKGGGDKPTFSPSVLVRYFERTEKGNADYRAWRERGEPKPTPEFETVQKACCHSFVTDGRIQFLGDCTHKLAGQTVDLPDFP